MHEGHNKNGRIATVYDRFDEVTEIAFNPPRFCERDGTELMYFSFYDSKDRFTLKAYCPICKKNDAVAVKQEKYEENMLKRWTKNVKERAGYKCEMASPECKGPCHAHHIVPKHLDPSKKYDVENGLCLCEAHHKMIHSYM